MEFEQLGIGPGNGDDHQRGNQGFTDTDEHVHVRHGGEGDRPCYRARQREFSRAHHRGQDGRAPRSKCCGHDHAPGTRDNAAHATVNGVAHNTPDDAHVENIGAQRSDATVGKEKTLDDEHGGENNHRRARAEQYGGQRAADQVT
ncbi:MAG: hypothetical protein ABSH14_08590 [Verrucomicrobiia bacterium]